MLSIRTPSRDGTVLTSVCLGLFIWILAPPVVSAQFLLPPCQIELETAHDAYLNQEYETAVDLASECVAQEGVSSTDAIEAYRLISLSFFRQQDLVDARRSITHILSIDPTYEADPVEDPPSYALLVSMVRDVLAVDTDSTRLARMALSTDSLSVRLPAAPLATSVGQNALSLSPSSFPLSTTRPSNETAPPVETTPGRASADPKGLLGTNGVRLTIRNRGYERINGLNLTLWRPQTASSYGHMNGLTLGVPMTGAAHLKGVGIGLFGVTGGKALHGLGVGGIGLTAGRLNGLALGGLGLQVSDHLYGISVNGGLTAGGGSLRGIAVSGLGLAVGGSVGGLQVGGLGVRAGDGIGGITLGTLGASSGGNVSGLTVTGGFLHAGDALRGVQATAGPIVADRVQGLAVGSMMVQQSGTGLLVAPLYAHTGRKGTLTGLSLSTFNHVRGHQRGLTIGLLNIAKDLGGVQLGLLNYAGNNPRFLRLLPGLNLNF